MANWQYKLKFKDTFVDDPHSLNRYQIDNLTARMAGRIRGFTKRVNNNEDLVNDLETIAEELQICDDIESIDFVIDNMYDVCDSYRIWVE